MTTDKNHVLPKAFVWKRAHSLTGLWLVGFLCLHFLINSQAALMVGEDGYGFIKGANEIRTLPYLYALEIIFLALPFAVHMFWGIQYLWTSKINSTTSDGSKPSLPEYPRNHAYTWQRITSWILLVLVVFHVVQMRFLEQPTQIDVDGKKFYISRVTEDPGLSSVSERLGVKLIHQAHTTLTQNAQVSHIQSKLKDNEVLIIAPDFGTAELLMVRETFKSPEMLILYTVLVLSACFHACNGLWTWMISWGITISEKSQKNMRLISNALMALLAFWGLAAVWGTYWINLKQ